MRKPFAGWRHDDCTRIPETESFCTVPEPQPAVAEALRWTAVAIDGNTQAIDVPRAHQMDWPELTGCFAMMKCAAVLENGATLGNCSDQTHDVACVVSDGNRDA
jgi:hypothetical protein